MDEYDYLLNINNNLVDNDIDDITDNDIVNNKNELSEQFNDGFFKYIFDNINLSRRDDIKNSSNNSEESNVKETDTNTNTNIEINEISSINMNQYNMNQDNMNQDNMNQDNINQDNINQDNMNQDNMNQDNMNQDNINQDNIILDFIKKIYKKIIIKCHPDKGGDKSLFIKCQEYYDNKFLIGILYIGYKVNFVLPELNNKIIEQILYEIRIIQQKIIYIKLKLKKNINK
jgi:pentapeptide MXKDX repeat protein